MPYEFSNMLTGGSQESLGAATASAEHAGCTNIFSEFATAAYFSGVERPLESIGQLLGVQMSPPPDDSHLTGIMKTSQIAGSVTGQIVDFLILSRITGGSINKIAAAAGEASLVCRTLAVGSIARATTTAATTGFLNGALLSPLQVGEGSFRRLENGLANAGSLALMGALNAKYASKFGDGFIGRVGLSTLSGGAGRRAAGLGDP